MANTDRLSQTITSIAGKNGIFDEDAINHENMVYNTSVHILINLRVSYPDLNIGLEPIIYKSDIAEILGIKNYKFKGRNPFIRPDGGIIVANGFPILITEAKKQGTNAKRLLENKHKQGKGNAIERSFKNLAEIQLYCKKLKYFPYVLFATGCDFSEDSSINDRLDAMTEYLPRNKVYVGEKKIVNLFVKETPFEKKEMIRIMWEVAIKSMKESGLISRIRQMPENIR